MKIGVVDYEAGNLTSVETALRYLNADFVISGDSGLLKGCDKIIFPGVGEASSAMKTLKSRGLDVFLKDTFKEGLPILGICLGCQIVLESSEENNTECLGLVPGKAVLFPRDMELKVPHMGWNQVETVKDHYLFEGIRDNSSFYFVHSYFPKLEKDENAVGKTDYGIRFSSVFSYKNLSAVQFHPEKSGEAGLKLLENFIRYR